MDRGAAHKPRDRVIQKNLSLRPLKEKASHVEASIE